MVLYDIVYVLNYLKIDYDCIFFYRSLYDNNIQTLINGTFEPLKSIQTL